MIEYIQYTTNQLGLFAYYLWASFISITFGSAATGYYPCNL